jgi:hypothetical protein
MQQLLFVFFLFFISVNISAQELYVFTNPASNIPGKAIAAKLSTKTMRSYHSNEREWRMMPEVQFGLNKNLMLSAAGSFSNMYFQDAVKFESVRLYSKYRFYSNDELHKHFRAAAFASAAWSKNPLVYQEISLDGDNSGVQVGVIATQLIKKFAASAGVSYIRQLEKTDKVNLGLPFSNEGIQYNISMGYLVFPRNYKSYKQTNFNLYCEFLGMKNTDIKRSFIDIAPAFQLIFNSSTRFNAGARFQMAGNAHRMAKESYFISIEYYFLNALK